MFGLFVLIRLNAYVLLSSWELILNSSMPGLERTDFFPSVINVRKLCRPQKHFFKQNWSKLDRMSEIKEKQTFLWEFNNSIVLPKKRIAKICCTDLLILFNKHYVFETNYQRLNIIDVLPMLVDSCSILNCLNYLKLMDHCAVCPLERATWTIESDWNKNCRPFLVNDDTIICQQCIHQENLKNLEQITM